jgi:hypothetical protein
VQEKAQVHVQYLLQTSLLDDVSCRFHSKVATTRCSADPTGPMSRTA